MYRKVYWLGFAILISDECYLHWWFLCMNDAWQLKHEYSSRSFAVWCWKVGHIIVTPNVTSWAHVDHFKPDSFEKFSILAFYAEKEITVMTNIKVLLKSCDHMNLNGHTSVFHPQTQESKMLKKYSFEWSH